MTIKFKNFLACKSGIYISFLTGLMFLFVLSGTSLTAQTSSEVPASLQESFQQLIENQLMDLKSEHEQHQGIGQAESNEMLVGYYEYVLLAFNEGQRDVNYAFVSALDFLLPADGQQGNRLQRNMFDPAPSSNAFAVANVGSQTVAYGRLKAEFKSAIDSIHLNNTSGLSNIQAFINLVSSNK